MQWALGLHFIVCLKHTPSFSCLFFKELSTKECLCETSSTDVLFSLHVPSIYLKHQEYESQEHDILAVGNNELLDVVHTSVKKALFGIIIYTDISVNSDIKFARVTSICAHSPQHLLLERLKKEERLLCFSLKTWDMKSSSHSDKQ